MEVKSLQIETAVKGELQGVKAIYDYDTFRNELTARNRVEDIFEPRVKIKKDQNMYIFNIDGQNKFAVDTGNLETRLNDFYNEKKRKEERKEEEQVHIRIEGLEINYLKSRTQEELRQLMQEIFKSQNSLDYAKDMENTKFKVERLITFFQEELKYTDQKIGYFGGIMYKREETPLWKMNKAQIQERIKTLNNIKKKIERLEKNQDKQYTIKWGKNGEVDVIYDDIQGFNQEITLIQLNQKIDELGKEAPDFIRTRNDILLGQGDTTPNYQIVINNRETARKMNNQLNNINKEYLKIIEINLGATKRQALQQDLIRLQEYLQNYINNPNQPLVPFEYTSGDAFELLCELDPNMKGFKQLNRRAKKPSDGEPNPEYAGYEAPGISRETTGTNTENQRGRQEYIPTNYGSGKEAFEKGGVSGIMNHWIDKTNMKPEQKQFRNGVGNIAVTGGMIFVGWKMISSAFKLFTKKGRSEGELGKNLGRLLGPAVLIFGAQARSGEGPMKIIRGGKITENIANIFGKKTNTENLTPQEQETQLRYAEGFPGATALFNGLTYGEMNQFLVQERSGRTKIDPTQYEKLLDMFKTGPKKNEAAAAFLESIGRDDKRGVIDLALKGMNISRNDLQNNPDAKFDKAASEAIVRLRSVTSYMDDKGYNKINPETQYLVDKYIKEGKSIRELEDLDARKDVFYKEALVTDKTGLENTIKDIAAGDIQREQELLLAINTFYDYMPNAEKNITLQGSRPNITFGTYNQTTKINLANKELVGFTPSRFSSYHELFKAANLTNYIKDIGKNKETKSEKPFHISTTTRNIEFSNPSSFALDTTILTAGRRGSLKQISPTLENNKQAYCDYLNSLQFRKTTS